MGVRHPVMADGVFVVMGFLCALRWIRNSPKGEHGGWGWYGSLRLAHGVAAKVSDCEIVLVGLKIPVTIARTLDYDLIVIGHP